MWIRDRIVNRMTAENSHAIYACLNTGEAFCLDEIGVRSICVNRDLNETMENLTSRCVGTCAPGLSLLC